MSIVAKFEEPQERGRTAPEGQEAVQEHRRARLNELIEAKCYQRAAIFSKISGINPSLASQYRTGVRQITERTVSMIEQAFALPHWFTQPVGTNIVADAPTVLDAPAALVAPPADCCIHGPECEALWDDLNAMLPEDKVVWIAQIKAAATKVRRANGELHQGESSLKSFHAA